MNESLLIFAVFLIFERRDCPGPLQMIDLSPQPQDKTAETTKLSAAPRHDPATKAPVSKRHHFSLFTYETAEAGVQLFSRWAGPSILFATLGLLGWWFLS